MHDDDIVTAARQAWQGRGVPVALVSPGYLRHLSREDARRTQARLALEYTLTAVALGLGAWLAFRIGDWWFRAGVALMSLGVLAGVYVVSRLGRGWPGGLDGSDADALTFYRRQLEQRRDAHRAIWRWSIPAALPGAVTILAWAAINRPADRWRLAVVVAGALVTMAAMLRHDAQEAQRYQRELDALDPPLR